MSRTLTQYRIFIASPSGLTEERNCFKSEVKRYSDFHGEPRGILFHPVGWEDTIAGAARAQSLINADLRRCDYAVFVIHDRWGSPTGEEYDSGFAEEWAIAKKMFSDKDMLDIIVMFKKIDDLSSRRKTKQLRKVIDFKKELQNAHQYLYKEFRDSKEFVDTLESALIKWHDLHRPATVGAAGERLAQGGSPVMEATNRMDFVVPGFGYWISEAKSALNDTKTNYADVLLFARKAVETSKADTDWAEAVNTSARANFFMGRIRESYDEFDSISTRFEKSVDLDRRYWFAKSLSNKGVALGALGRHEEAITTYDNVIARLNGATETALREQIAIALVNKGITLGALGRGEQAITTYDNVIARFGEATETDLREQVAYALFNKGVTLGELGRGEEAITTYDSLIARFAEATETALREHVAYALFNKGFKLGELGRGEEAITTYDNLIDRFGEATETALREQVAKALFNKGFRLVELGRGEEAITTYDSLIARFAEATETALRAQVAKARIAKNLAEMRKR